MKELSPELIFLMLVKAWGMTLVYPVSERARPKPKEREAKIDSEAAYAMIRYWPDHELRLKNSEGKHRWWAVNLVDSTVKNPPRIEFWTIDALEQAVTKAKEMEGFFKASMDPAEVEGKGPFGRAAAIFAKFGPVLEQRAKAALAEAKTVKLAAQRDQMRSAARDPSSKLFDAELSVKHGARFTTSSNRGQYIGQTTTVESSMKSALKLLRDPTRPLVSMTESESGLGDGTVSVSIVLGRNGHMQEETWIDFKAPPLSVLKTQSDMTREVLNPKQPKKPLRDRTDIM